MNNFGNRLVAFIFELLYLYYFLLPTYSTAFLFIISFCCLILCTKFLQVLRFQCMMFVQLAFLFFSIDFAFFWLCVQLKYIWVVYNEALDTADVFSLPSPSCWICVMSWPTARKRGLLYRQRSYSWRQHSSRLSPQKSVQILWSVLLIASENFR